MENKKNPAEFLGTKIIGSLNQEKIKGGKMLHQVGHNDCPNGGRQYDCQYQQQQTVQNDF